MLIDTEKYIPSLKKLWYGVFGDSEEYISLIFDKGYTPSEVFATVSGEEVVSALYLLKCNISVGEKVLSGRYLYAAATSPEHRKQGLMSKLICEAKEYIAANNIDFIALVPANENLYGYYRGFGFETLMYNFCSVAAEKGKSCVTDKISDSVESIMRMRDSYRGAKLTFEIPEMKYAVSCLDFAGYSFYKNSDDSYYITDNDSSEVIEYISSEENFRENTELLLSRLGEGTVITSPYDLSGFCESRKQKFGMVYFVSDNLKNIFKSGIYMNIALD